MYYLIAESKTMKRDEQPVAPELYASHTPIFEAEADGLAEAMRGLDAGQLASRVKVSLKLARDIHRMIYEFPDKSCGIEAIRAFTGVVFRQLKLSEYDAADRDFLDSHVRIISSAYGWLRPSDIIKPYRHDFGVSSPAGMTMKRFWRAKVTNALINEIDAIGESAVVNLLPKDASDLINWKLIGKHATVYRIEFKTPAGPSMMKTPPSGRLKELRGIMLNLAVRHRIDTPEALRELACDDFMPQEEPNTPDSFDYLC